MSFLEQTVIQAYFGGVGVLGRYPMDVAFDFDSISTSRAGLGVWQVFAVHDGDIASSVFLKARALDHIAVAQAHRVIREQAEIALGRHFHEILTFYPKSVSYTHLRAHETDSYLVCRLLLEKKK